MDSAFLPTRSNRVCIRENKGETKTNSNIQTFVDKHSNWISQFIKADKDGMPQITDSTLLHQKKHFVGFVGPPGSGKSTLCNAALFCQQNIKYYVFPTSPQDEPFTKGVWILSPKAKLQLPKLCDWEVMDLEGFEPDENTSWKLSMILSVLAEVVVFCNREPRAVSIYKTLKVFEAGRAQTKVLNMKPVTKQVYIVLSPKACETNGNIIIEKFKQTLNGIKVNLVVIPDIDRRNEITLPFDSRIIDPLKNMINNFDFDTNSQAVASKSNQLFNLLEAFNKEDFNRCKELSFSYFQRSCELIYNLALCNFKTEHIIRARSLELKSLDISLEEFADNPNYQLSLDFTSSTYFSTDFESWCESYYGPISNLRNQVLDLYKLQYLIKRDELKQKKNMEFLKNMEKQSNIKIQDLKRKIEENKEKYQEMIEQQTKQIEEIEKLAQQKLAEKLKQLNLKNKDDFDKEKITLEEQMQSFFEDKRKHQRERQHNQEVEIRLANEELDNEMQEQLKIQRLAKFNICVDKVIAQARHELRKTIRELEDKRPLFTQDILPVGGWNKFIDAKNLGEFNNEFEPDWTPFINEYHTLRKKMEEDWNRQIENSKWKNPVEAHGELICERGCKIESTLILCLQCSNQLYWCDGPNFIVICQGGCPPRKFDSKLLCPKCKSNVRCEVRLSNFVP